MKIIIRITPGSHSTEESINRQLADKERVRMLFEFLINNLLSGFGCYGKCEFDANDKFLFEAAR